eukprot:scaffold11971_cov20-Tisochrysis_lutea.AAC.1
MGWHVAVHSDWRAGSAAAGMPCQPLQLVTWGMCQSQHECFGLASSAVPEPEKSLRESASGANLSKLCVFHCRLSNNNADASVLDMMFDSWNDTPEQKQPARHHQ